MYNFGISSQLKTYFDWIARAGITFQYTANGPEGLVKGKKVSSCRRVAASTRARRTIAQTPYLKSFLGFLGMTDVNFIYAEGLNMGPDVAGAALAAAREAIVPRGLSRRRTAVSLKKSPPGLRTSAWSFLYFLRSGEQLRIVGQSPVDRLSAVLLQIRVRQREMPAAEKPAMRR